MHILFEPFVKLQAAPSKRLLVECNAMQANSRCDLINGAGWIFLIYNFIDDDPIFKLSRS